MLPTIILFLAILFTAGYINNTIKYYYKTGTIEHGRYIALSMFIMSGLWSYLFYLLH